tara:strand:+ start:1739 stop:1945 length:207 start_codon:yes stop_codon:yes gene_type:complete
MAKRRDTNQLSLELINHKPSDSWLSDRPKIRETPICLTAARANRSREDLLEQLQRSGLTTWKKMKVNS